MLGNFRIAISMTHLITVSTNSRDVFLFQFLRLQELNFEAKHENASVLFK